VNVQEPREHGWIFVGRWLFADTPDHVETMEDPSGLVEWADGAFTDLLPLWMSVYRDAAR
jgi:hypothetical protein